MWSAIKSDIPFVPVPPRFFKDIEKSLNLKDGDILYNLSCGDGRVLFYLSQKHKNIKYIGIENSIFPLIILKFKNWWCKITNKSTIEIIQKDIFEVNLSSATHIFIHLYPHVMDDIASKFDEELKPGTKVISLSFPFTSTHKVEEIEIEKIDNEHSRKIYIYEF